MSAVNFKLMVFVPSLPSTKKPCPDGRLASAASVVPFTEIHSPALGWRIAPSCPPAVSTQYFAPLSWAAFTVKNSLRSRAQANGLPTRKNLLLAFSFLSVTVRSVPDFNWSVANL